MYHFRLPYSGKDLGPLGVLLGALLGVLRALYSFKNIAHADSLVLQLPLIRLSLRSVLNN